MIVRTGYLLLGHLSVAAGVVGLLLPLVPTTPFVLLAALCYSRGSNRFHRWIHRHRLFGRMLRDWQDGGAIAPPAKVGACLGFAASVVLAWLRLGPSWGVAAVLVAAAGIAFILSRPSRSPVAALEADRG